MSKTQGIGSRLFVAGVDLSGDTGALSAIGSARAALDLTGIDADGHERRYGLRDGRIEWQAWFNPTGAHPVLASLPTSDVLVSFWHRPLVGAHTADLVGKQVGYDGTRNQDGSLTLTVSALANRYGLEYGRGLTPGIAVHSEGPDEGAGFDFGAAVGETLFGLQAYLHVVALTGDDVTVAIQHSDDNGDEDEWANVPGGVFAEVANPPGAPTTQRLQTDRDETVKRWLRVATTGSFTSASFSVSVVKNRTLNLFEGLE